MDIESLIETALPRDIRLWDEKKFARAKDIAYALGVGVNAITAYERSKGLKRYEGKKGDKALYNLGDIIDIRLDLGKHSPKKAAA